MTTDVFRRPKSNLGNYGISGINQEQVGSKPYKKVLDCFKRSGENIEPPSPKRVTQDAKRFGREFMQTRSIKAVK